MFNQGNVVVPPPPRFDSLPGAKPPQKRTSSAAAFWLCAATAVGLVLFAIGGLVLARGYEALMTHVVPRKLSVTDGSEILESWLFPPVQPYMRVFAFNVTNHVDVAENRAKPILQEVGPFVYKSVTVKDDAGLEWDDVRGTLTYRPRKIYTYVPEMSVHPSDFDHELFLPNLPFLTALNAKEGFTRSVAVTLVTTNGRGTPFIKVSLGEYLWGYEDDLPCLRMNEPKECSSDGGDDDFIDFDMDDFRRRKRRSAEEGGSGYEALVKPKAEFVDCKCNWGLFRDRNVTLREPIRFFTGGKGPRSKGSVDSFNGSKTLGFWKPGSSCDLVSGQDSSTFPPNGPSNQTIFIPLLCRSLPLAAGDEVFYDGVRTVRYEPTANALGTPEDTDPEARNEANGCYCRKDLGYDCFESGVLNMGPCKRATGTRPPLALSMPHFLDAHPSFIDAVEGLNPDADKHRFHVDLVPELGIPLAMKARFQLNVVLTDDGGDTLKLHQEKKKLVLPMLWAEEGFGSPSEELQSKVVRALGLPHLIVSCAGSIFILVGLVLVAVVLCCRFSGKCAAKRSRIESYQMQQPKA